MIYNIVAILDHRPNEDSNPDQGNEIINADQNINDNPIDMDGGMCNDKQIDGNNEDDIEDGDEGDESASSSLHPDDPANFLKLGCALKILTRQWIREDEIDDADRLLREYCTELLTVSMYICYKVILMCLLALWLI